MRKDLVESYIDKLRASLGPIKAPVAEEKLRIMYDARDYAGMIGHIKSVLRLDMGVVLGLVNRGGPKEKPNSPAWIEKPQVMPPYGTSAFRQVTVTLYLRKSFVEGSFDETVLAIAHEFSHIVLDAICHPLRQEEEAVDLTAMLLGFRDFYITGCRSVRQVESANPYEATYQVSQTGYLTPEEVGHAAMYMTFR